MDAAPNQGREAPLRDHTRTNFKELCYLEQSNGETGCTAMKPFKKM
jgi:hypothetical protein